MPSINFANDGYTGPPDFFDAGAMQEASILDALANTVTISGGVFLGSEFDLAAVDTTVYATASTFSNVSPGPGVQEPITITFTEPISDFSVTIFNGLSTSATYQISDNKGDSTTVTLGPNSASDNSQSAFLSNTHGATQVTITAIGVPYDFSIDNIVYDFSAGDVEALTSPILGAELSNMLSNAVLLSELGDLLSPSSASDLFFALQAITLICASELLLPSPSVGEARTLSGTADTFDPNYKLPYAPTFVQLPTISPDSTITPQTANDANAAMSDFSKAVAYVQALEVTVNRLNSAMQEGDQASVALQNASFDTFLSLASSSLAAAGKDLNTLTHDFAATNLPTVTTQEINNFLNNLQLNGVSGLPQQEQNLFNLFGLSSTDEQNIVSELLSVNPSSVPTTLVTALQGAETAVLGVAGVTGGSAVTTNGVLSNLSLDQQMELIYIGYFNRSADVGGFNFWEGQNATAQAQGQSAAVALTNIANSFAPQAETEAIYPFLSSPNPNFSNPTVQAGLTTFIGNVYENLFDRAGDSGGVGYWTGQIESGAVGLGAAVLAIANGATGSDATILVNKVTVALDFTNLTSAANLPTTPALLAEAKTILAGVDGIYLNDVSVTAAEAAIAPWIASQQTAALIGSAAHSAHLELA